MQPPESTLSFSSACMDIRDCILYDDGAVLAVNKPAGLRTIPDGYDASLPHLGAMLQAVFGKVWVVHRLDKDTSGVILFALDPETHRDLNIQFQQRETRKEYRALVLGVLGWQQKQVSLPLLVNGDRRHRTVVDGQKGRAARTDFELLHSSHGISYLAAYPHSGYTHQIRAHLAAIGLPLLHDSLYQSRLPETRAQVLAQEIQPTLPIQRTPLHAYQVSFRHPKSGEMIIIKALEPEDFLKTLEILQYPRSME